MELTIYRRDFRDHADRPGVSMFEDVLRQLRIDESKLDEIETALDECDNVEFPTMFG